MVWMCTRRCAGREGHGKQNKKKAASKALWVCEAGLATCRRTRRSSKKRLGAGAGVLRVSCCLLERSLTALVVLREEHSNQNQLLFVCEHAWYHGYVLFFAHIMGSDYYGGP